jgi:hypothetical protein
MQRRLPHPGRGLLYSDDRVKTLLDRLGASLHGADLSTLKMEGFLQRTVTTPSWTLPTFSPGRTRYRLRYWINRLPTFEDLKWRGDRRDATCPRCHLASETQSHGIIYCHSNLAHLQKFRIRMLRTLRSHLSVFPPQISAREVRTLLLHKKIPCQIVEGWSPTTYDNHDRSKVLLQGERLLKIESIMLTYEGYVVH